LVHVADRPGVVGGTTVAVVLELNLVGHVVEQSLNRTELTVGVVGSVSPFNDEDLVRVASLKGVGLGRVGVDTLRDGRNVLSLEVVLNRVVDFQVFDVGAPCTSGERTLCAGLAGFLGHGSVGPATSRATVWGDSVVEGWTDTCSAADVQTSCWVAAVDDGHRNGALLGVRVLHGAVRHLRLERVRRWCNVTDLVGDVAGVGLTAVVAGSEGETTPSVG